MSLEISLDNKLDPFAKPYQECSKPGCGGRLALRVESNRDGTQRTYQICRKCNNAVLTAEVNVIRVR